MRPTPTTATVGFAPPFALRIAFRRALGASLRDGDERDVRVGEEIRADCRFPRVAGR
jgi:hypothetical protein